MLTVSISTEYIRMDQLLKLANLVAGGGEAKALIQGGEVSLNGEVERRRGKKVRVGDKVALFEQLVEVTAQPPGAC